MAHKVLLDVGVDVTREGVVVAKGEGPRTVTAHYAHGEVVEDVPAEQAEKMIRWGHLEVVKDAATPFVAEDKE